jgi:beta-galactosidase
MKRSMIFVKLLLLALFAICPFFSSAQINYSEKIRLNDNWEFVRKDLGNVWEAVRPVAKDAPEAVPVWEKINLPHCFNAEDAVDPDVNYYQGPGWYRTNLLINNPYPQGRVLLQFEGAGQKTDVYIHTQHVANHVGGYDEWTVDITDAVNKFAASEDAARFKGKIPLIIRCDNSRDTEMIPSDMSDFNVYGGIYRYLNLIYTPSLSFSSIRTDATVDENGKEGKITIVPAFAGLSEIKDISLNCKLFSPDGKLIREETKPVTNRNADNSFTWSVAKPTLWSPDAPNLYACELTVTTPNGTATNREVFGFRHYEFKDKGAFFLNGKRLLLRGTHRHEDHAGLAAAMTEDLINKELEMIHAMGANFIRLGHYQQSRIVLEQCDRLGILVWEEIPWCRGGLGGEVYQQQAKRMLVNMINQHRNHPSIILWGLGNENDWPNDFPEFDKEEIRTFMTELHNLAHQLDPGRLTSIRRCDFCKDIVDVYSPSIWAGWYQGQYSGYKNRTESAIQQTDHFFHAEWGGDSQAHRHAETIPEGINHDRNGDWSETYICDLFDWHLKEQETMPWLTGSAFWTFKDFSTPIRPENPIPYVNQKGVVERDLTPKESYYVVQSYWSEKPMIHIYGHGWQTRWGAEEEQKTMKVYSNCETVELFLNGKSLGVKKRNSQDFPAAGLRWKSVLQSGNNTLKAIGKQGKVIVVDELSFEYETRAFGKPIEIHASIIQETDDYAWIEAELRDTNGIVCLDARSFIYFESVGDGWLIANQGTTTGSKKVQAYNGRARVKLIKNKGNNTVAVKSDALKTVFVNVSHIK